jgi:ferredoxin
MQVALVTEDACIGCTACLQACPTGAIVGAAKHIHTIIATLCTGCEACVPVCPVPCIQMHPWPEPTHPAQGANAGHGVALAAAHAARQTGAQPRNKAESLAAVTATIPGLPPELLAKVTAARDKSQAKYQKMGPQKRPRALPPPR